MVRQAARRHGSATTWHSVMPWAYSWLADDLADGAVASWADGQNGVTLTQGTPGAQPIRAATSGPNGQPGVTFDGVNDYMTAASVSISQPDTIIAMARWTGIKASTSAYFLDGTQSTSTRHLIGPDRAGGGSWWQFAGAFNDPGTLTADTSPHVVRGFYSGSSSVLAIDTTTATGDAGTQPFRGLIVGTDRLLSGFTGLVLCALGIIGGDATARPEWPALAAYIAAKWGLVA